MKAWALLLLTASVLEGKDFGPRGTLFPIAEESMSAFFSKSLASMTGVEFEKKQEDARRGLIWLAQHPTAVIGLKEATEYRAFRFDPSYGVREEIRNSRGDLIASPDERVNPLEQMTLSSGLLFFDGENPQHLAWAQKQTPVFKLEFKWILVKGSPLELEQKEQRPVYFDQGGRYVSHFQIEHIPCKVSQKETFLLIEEIPVLEEIHALTTGEDLATDTIEPVEKKCPSGGRFPSEGAPSGTLLLFTSFALPLESWEDHSLELDRAGGSFVLNGIPNNSFLEFAAKVEELRKRGIEAPIMIDPIAFEKYGIGRVPAIVVDDGRTFDKIEGNIPLWCALKMMTDSGTVPKLPQKLLAKVKRVAQ